MASLLGKEFEPSRKYKVVLSQRLLNSSKNPYTVSSVQLERDLKLPHAVRNATLSPGFGSNDCELSLTGAADGKESLYNGNTSKPGTYALIYDGTTGTFTLESIDARYAFAADNDTLASGEQSEAALLNSLIEEEGVPEEDNPFDWRHQLKRQRTPSPDIEPFTLDTGATASPAASPLVQPVRQRVRQASSPPGEVDFEEEASPERLDHEAEREEFEIGGEESEEEGGLEISYDGANKKPSYLNRGRVAQRRTAGPIISLRSAANSRSPAINYRSESDEDVDIMQLGSPQREIRSGAQNGPKDDPVEMEIETTLAAGNNDDADDEAMFEAEFAAAMEADYDDDVQAPASQNYVVDDSSSESEEE